MLIDCPCCGKRDRREFTYLGDATVARPGMENTDHEDWYAFVYQRENPRGWHREIWQHSQGCRSFIEVRRNTVTHDIESARLIGPWAEKAEAG